MNRINRPQNEIMDWTARWISVVLCGVVFAFTLSPDALNSAGYVLVSTTLFITLISYLLLPTIHNFHRSLINCLSIAVALLIVHQTGITKSVPFVVLCQLNVISLALYLLLNSLNQLSDILYNKKDLFHKSIFLCTIIVILLPVWLSPWVDVTQPTNETINQIVSMTPLTHFSVAAQYDYLRSEWFYRNTSFGSLPFTYPGWKSIITNYLLIIALLQITLWIVMQRIKKTAVQQTTH